MASLTGQLVAETYKALLKLIDNDILTASEKQITDGFGGGSNVFIDSQGFLRANKYKVTNGLATQFLKADGSLDANSYLTSITGAQVITALGFTPVPTTRTITINGETHNLAADNTWTVGGTSAIWGNITGTLSNQTDLQNALNAKFDDPTGDSTQYIDGSGALQTFPTFLSSDNLIKLVRNQSGGTMTAGTIVYINGATGNKPTIAKALATSDATSAQTYGMVQANIANNADGYIVVIGNVNNLNTHSLDEGAQLYLSATTAGAWTTTKQYAPNHLVYVGIVLRSHPNQGIIGVKIQNGYELDELHDVSAQSPTNNDGIFFEASTSLWKNKSIATVLGYTPQAQLSGTGFVKASGTTISYDNSTYLTTADAASTYQRLDKMVSNLLASDTEYPNSNAVIAALALKANAENPVFTGYMTISGAEPKLYFTDTDQNPDYFIGADAGFFKIYDQTAGATRFQVNSDGNISTGVGKSITAGSFVKESGTASQFLKADGSIDSSTYVSTSVLADYLLSATAASTYQRLDKMVSNLLASDTEYPNSNAVLAKLALKADAANPVFTGNMTISGAEPKLYLTDTDQNPDYFIGVDAGYFRIYNQTAGQTKFVINSDGDATFTNSVTASSFIGNVTGNVSGSAGSVAWSGVTGKPTTLSGYGITDAANMYGDTTKQFNVFELTYANTAFNPSAAARTTIDANSVKMWNNYFYGIGLGSDYGTVMQYYSQAGHVESQVYFDASGGSWYRTASYNANYGGWQRYITDGNISSYALPLSGGTLTGKLQINANYAGTNPERFTIRGTYPSIGLRSTNSDSNWLIHNEGNLAFYYATGVDSDTWGRRMYLDTSGTLRLMDHIVLTAGNYTSYSPSLTGYGASGTWGINISGSSDRTYRAIIEDTRSAQRTPNDYEDYRTSWEFTNQIASGWRTAMTMQGWHDGYTAWQIVGPADTTANETWYLRSGVNTTWNPLRIIIHSGNIGAQSVTYADNAGAVGTVGESRIVYGENSTATTSISNATLDGALKSGFYTVGSGGIPNATGVNFVLHTAYAGVGNLAGFDLACNDSTTSQFYLRPATGVGKGAWQTIMTNQNIGSYAIPYRTQTNWNDSTVINNVVGLLAWRNYGNSHVIFDASSGTSPNGTSVNSTNSSIPWANSYPSLMGWNGASTYGLRVDSARVSDSASTSSTVTHYSARTDSATYNVVWAADNPSHMYSCDAVNIQSSTGTLNATNLVSSSNMIVGANGQPYAYSGASNGKLYFGTNGADAIDYYNISTAMENVGGNYSKLDLRWYTGQRFYAASIYGGFRFKEITTGTTIFSINEGDSNVRVTNTLIASALTVGSGGSSTIRMQDSDEGNREIHCNSNRIGFLNQSSSWGSWCNDDGSWEATNMYSYNGFSSSSDVSSDVRFGIHFNGMTDFAYAIYRESGAWTFPYPDLRIAFHTGISLGANPSYGGIRFFDDYQMNTVVLYVNNASYGGAGNVYAVGSVSASAFYETSDMRLKKLIDGSAQIDGIEKLEAKLYEKDGKIELGYFAQEAELIMPNAITKNADGFMNLSYREVHTAKIARLEKEVAELKEKLKVE